jgi:hypothetical protein
MNRYNTLIATSIAPGPRIDVQRRAVESWREAGLNFVSLNSPAEIEQLAARFPDVDFIPQFRDARLAVGKPVIYINDILQHFRNSGADRFGIINSDIFVNGAAMDVVISQSENVFIACPRTEVENFGDATGSLDPIGYDAFFFARAALPVWNETQFCLGMPFWDHWFPMMPLLARHTCLKLHSPVFQHIPHPVSRDDSFFMFNDHFAGHMAAAMQDNSIGFGDGFQAHRFESLRDTAAAAEASEASEEIRLDGLRELAVYYDELSRYTVKFIDEKFEKIESPA